MRPVFRYTATEGVKRKKSIAPEHSPRFFTTFAPMENSYRYDGITLRYDIEGEGETLLLLHGWGCDREIWKQIRRCSAGTIASSRSTSQDSDEATSRLRYGVWRSIRAR